MKSASPALTAKTRRSQERASRSRQPSKTVPAANWSMPSGVALAEFALRGGFVAPGLMRRSAPGAGDRS